MTDMSATELRIQAVERGERFFTTGQPCKRGHHSKRYASNGCCVECLTPGAGRRALDKFQAQVVKRFAFYALVPAASSEDDVLQLKRYLATCMLNWEKSKGYNVGNNWGPKVNGELPW